MYGELSIFTGNAHPAFSLMGAGAVLRARGARDIVACCVHVVLSGPAVERIKAAPIQRLLTTDTVRLDPHKWMEKLEVVSVASLLGEAISRIHAGTSVGEMFRTPARQLKFVSI